MPLPVAHGLLGASIVAAMRPRTSAARLPLLYGALLANAADLDFLLVFASHNRSWHRGFTHSLVFALFVCLLFLLFFGKQRIRRAIGYGLAFASHALLDFATTKKGGGLELLWPFSNARFALGWQGLSELPSQLPPAQVFKALCLEFALFAPLLALLLLRTFAARRKANAEVAALNRFEYPTNHEQPD